MSNFLNKIFSKKAKQSKIPEKIFEESTINIKDIIAPSAIKVEKNYLEIGEKLAKTFFIFSYPRYLSTGWISPLVNLESLMNISIFFYPIDSATYLRQLTNKVAQVQAETMEKEEKGKVRDLALEIAYQGLFVIKGIKAAGIEGLPH